MRKHWSVDEERIANKPVFKINGGLKPDEKLEKKEIIKYWLLIKNKIHPYYKQLL